MTENTAILSWEDRERLIVVLADNLHGKRAELDALLAKINRRHEDLVYRFYVRNAGTDRGDSGRASVGRTRGAAVLLDVRRTAGGRHRAKLHGRD